VTVDLGAAIAVGSIIFAAGGAWITLSTTARRGAEQGKRIGKVEIKIANLEGMLRPRRLSAPLGVPVVSSSEEPTAGG